MHLAVDVYHDICSYLPNSDLLSLMLSCKDISNVAKKYLHPTWNHLKKAVESNNIVGVRTLLKYPQIDPRSEDNWMLTYVTDNMLHEIAKIIIMDGRIDPSISNDALLFWMCNSGNLELVQMLLKDPRVDPCGWKNDIIQHTCRQGHVEVVKLLLQDPRVDPNTAVDDYNDYPIQCASEAGHVDVVRLLLSDPRVDPTVDDNLAIKEAILNDHRDVVQLLLQDPRVAASYKP